MMGMADHLVHVVDPSRQSAYPHEVYVTEERLQSLDPRAR